MIGTVVQALPGRRLESSTDPVERIHGAERIAASFEGLPMSLTGQFCGRFRIAFLAEVSLVNAHRSAA